MEEGSICNEFAQFFDEKVKNIVFIVSQGIAKCVRETTRGSNVPLFNN